MKQTAHLKFLFAALCAVMLSACVISKNRYFVPVDSVIFESWQVIPRLLAFKGSSKASWDQHKFAYSIDVTRWPDYKNTQYDISLSNLALYAGACPGRSPIEIGAYKIKSAEQGRQYAGTDYSLYIEPKIRFVCAMLHVDFTPKDGGPVVPLDAAITMKRREFGVPFIYTY